MGPDVFKVIELIHLIYGSAMQPAGWRCSWQTSVTTSTKFKLCFGIAIATR
jgi:hypothetical protein